MYSEIDTMPKMYTKNRLLTMMIYGNGMSVIVRKVLVTRDRIDPTAIELLRSKGFECVFSPPYAEQDEVVRTARDAKVCAIMVSQGKITRSVISASGSVEVMAKHGSGVNNINLAAAEELGIPVYRAVGGNATAVAEYTISLMLSLWKSLPHLDAATKSGDWLKGSFVGNDIRGAKLGLIGLGVIGREVARLGAALGFDVMAYDPAPSSAQHSANGIRLLDTIDQLIRQSDIISLHCPLTPATRHLVDAKLLAKMKSTSVLINTARGGIVDEDALADALQNGEIAGAGIDSFEVEPPSRTSRIWDAPNIICSPHSAGLTPGAERAMATMAARFIIDHFEGRAIDPAFRATSTVHGGLQE
ncbi:dimethylmenaquinone methyltransferase [Nitratireductor aquibiodomus RA22]|uniref:Dimethylmenaquinone methyltransferase n=1 Tax=Nitratireductor aquibiodomus RA22 TaxID=1189611 RepID=I5BV89_9HYPH|nr:hydroxyacid dehydrogenase [Nitratireductor aquibiodomus]EIM73491.1 dimethylmenaquinone methyltransferase [Nitratireductor aquibiodomus RA22]